MQCKEASYNVPGKFKRLATAYLWMEEVVRVVHPAAYMGEEHHAPLISDGYVARPVEEPGKVNPLITERVEVGRLVGEAIQKLHRHWFVQAMNPSIEIQPQPSTRALGVWFADRDVVSNCKTPT